MPDTNDLARKVFLAETAAVREHLAEQEQQATAKAEAALAPLEAKARALREQQQAEYRAAVLRDAADQYAKLIDQNEAYELAEHGLIDHESRLQYEAVRDVVAGLRRMADETQPAQPWPSVTDYALEVWETDQWVGITHRRKTLDDARERRESYRSRFPGRRFRIVRWDETSTVVECDPEPASEARQDGAQP